MRCLFYVLSFCIASGCSSKNTESTVESKPISEVLPPTKLQSESQENRQLNRQLQIRQLQEEESVRDRTAGGIVWLKAKIKTDQVLLAQTRKNTRTAERLQLQIQEDQAILAKHESEKQQQDEADRAAGREPVPLPGQRKAKW